VVLKPFRVAHLEHAIEQALDLPKVTASANFEEAEPPSDNTGRPVEQVDGNPEAAKPH